MEREREPIVFRWESGEVGVGYLGDLRWRVVSREGPAEVPDARAAAAAVMARMFHGVVPGREVEERAPVRIEFPDRAASLQADPRMVNGWAYGSAIIRCDVGPHSQLPAFIADLLAQNADQAWARGVEPKRPRKLGAEFSFQAFERAPDRNGLCRLLSGVLTQRVRRSPSAERALLSAIEELRELGHDLWNLDDGPLWGADYTRRRPGAGLEISLGEDEDTGGQVVSVIFEPRR